MVENLSITITNVRRKCRFEFLLQEVNKLVVFAYHTKVMELLKERLEHFGLVTITGKTPVPKRHEYVNQFQTDKNTRIFLGQYVAAGVGHTLTASSNVVFVESSWVPGDIDQAVDRCHRIGQKDAVTVQFIVMSQSVEEHMLRTVIDKKRTINRIVEGSNAN